jgi:hypothetical protein
MKGIHNIVWGCFLCLLLVVLAGIPAQGQAPANQEESWPYADNETTGGQAVLPLEGTDSLAQEMELLEKEKLVIEDQVTGQMAAQQTTASENLTASPTEVSTPELSATAVPSPTARPLRVRSR